MAELRTRYPDSMLQFLAYSPTEATMLKQPNATQNREETPKETPSKETPSKETPPKETPSKETPPKETPSKETPSKETPSKETISQSEIETQKENEIEIETPNDNKITTHNEIPSQPPSQATEQPAKRTEESELNEAEAQQALLRWRQLHLVVGVDSGSESKGTAISRLTGEEDVHDITNVDDIKREVDQFQPIEANFTGSLGSRA